ncbi:hypothetical protein CBS101457_006656 [Exobasidium rhododendri]|nr:hypothetical protein CBS101457_006656 [Exobasidium rhododendri]
MHSLEPSSSKIPPTQKTSERPFTPNDFRRENKSVSSSNVTRLSSSSTPATSTIRSLPVSQSSPSPYDTFTEADEILSDRITPRKGVEPLHSFQIMGRERIEVREQVEAFIDPIACQGSKQERQGHLQDWREEAEKDWQSLQERRSSCGALRYQPQASLAKSALLPKSDLDHASLFGAEDQHSPSFLKRVHSNRSNEFSATSPFPTTSPFATMQSSPNAVASPSSPQSALTLAKERDASAYHRALEALSSQKEKAPTPNENHIQDIRRGSMDALQRAKSLMSTASSKLGGGSERIRDVPLPSSPEHVPRRASEGLPVLPIDDQRAGRTRSRSITFSHKSKDTPPRKPKTSNVLSNVDKVDQMKRSKKLASMLGNEWWRGSEEPFVDRMDRETNSSPLKVAAVERVNLFRRKSDPLHLQHWTGRNEVHDSSVLEEQYRGRYVGRATSARWKPLLLRSRSSSNLRRDALPIRGTPPWKPLSSPPLDIHPKAAALLGLPLSAPHDTFSRRWHREGSLTELNSSSSTIEMLRDSDPLSAQESKESVTFRRVFDYHHKDREEGWDDDTETDINRMERRRRVRKISELLGAVVPPHLIRPLPEAYPFSERAEEVGYVLDDVPSSTITDYTTGSPIHSSGKTRSSPEVTTGNTVLKARAASHAKLGKKNASDLSNERSAQYSLPLRKTDTELISPLSEVERMANVKRNHKLTSVFGEMPPQDLVIESNDGKNRRQRRGSTSMTACLSEGQEAESPGKQRTRVFRSASPTTVTRLATSTPSLRSTEEPAWTSDRASWNTMSTQRGSNQYRFSIDSLEYLIKKNPPLLDEFISAVVEDAQGGERSAASRANLPTTVTDTHPIRSANFRSDSTSSSNDDLGSSMDHHLHHRTSHISLSDDCAIDAAQELQEHKVRVRRQQKLNRWFGEPPPFEAKKSAPEEAADEDHVYWITDPHRPALDRERMSPSKNSLPSPCMAPRLAGSASRPSHALYNRALGNIINSIEGELLEDVHLPALEKDELHERLSKLRNDSQLHQTSS